MTIHSIPAAAALLLLVSCTISPVASDAGTTDAGSQTVGDQCSTIARALCSHASTDCGVAVSSLSQCTADQALTCCTGSACNATSLTSRSALNACTSAIAIEGCNEVVTLGVAGVSVCQGIPDAP